MKEILNSEVFPYIHPKSGEPCNALHDMQGGQEIATLILDSLNDLGAL